ncbi:MAG: TIGR03905 family TSCPD domain-containing protein [Deltaproteobacteria bacterium]|jgi:uncharacterized protein (TIGR03905 family)|nr:TIGR03905 family TSCPD domain-containing protein [Deltaproteobacteria bacterium]
MEYESVPKGVCPRQLRFELNGGIISGIEFTGGCPGNLKAIGLLAEGQPAAEVAATLSGLTCGLKKTSCGDQLAKAIKKALKEEKKIKAPAKVKGLAITPEKTKTSSKKSGPPKASGRKS